MAPLIAVLQITTKIIASRSVPKAYRETTWYLTDRQIYH